MTRKTQAEPVAHGKPKEPPTRPLLDAGFGRLIAPETDTSPTAAAEDERRIDAPKAEE